jgi:stage II sporulation protein AA (anti-sigma F factor antagonist)
MTFTESRSGDVLVAALAGELDGFTAADVESQFTRLIDGGERRLVVDLAGVEYISSVGLGMLVVVHKKLRAAGGHFKFCNARPTIQELFKVSGLLQLLDFKATKEEAIASFA